MNAENVIIEETFTVAQPEATTWHVDTELSNIISLAEQGLLHTPRPEDKFDDDFIARDYSPLNEW